MSRRFEVPQAPAPPASVPPPAGVASAPAAQDEVAQPPAAQAEVAPEAAVAPPVHPPVSTAVLRVSGLSVARGSRIVVSEVTIDVPPGEVTALLGPTAPASRVSYWRSEASCDRSAGRSRSASST